VNLVVGELVSSRTPATKLFAIVKFLVPFMQEIV
jgi:hypothetical protein